MTIAWEAVSAWPVRALVAGGAVLLAGRLLVALTRQPARRVWVGTAAVVAALLVVPLSLLPGWVPVSVPAAGASTDPAPVEEPSTTMADLPAVTAGNPVAGSPRGSGFQPDLLFGQVGNLTHGPAPSAPAEVVPVTTASAGAADGPRFAWLPVLAWGYGVVAAGLLARLMAGQLALARLWRKAHPAPVWAQSVFRRLAGPDCPRAELRVTAGGVGPVCFGILRPRVLVPASLLVTGDGPHLRAVFAHELAHLGRRDPLAGWLLGLARAAYFVCPWLAGLRREVRVAQECLADAAAATHAAGPAPYAELLIRMARSRPAPLGAAGARGPSSELYRRVTMLLRSTGPVERRCPRRWALAVGGGLTALAVLVAGLSVQPRPAGAAEPKKAEPDKSVADAPDAAKKAEPDRKPAARPDPIKDALDKLKDDLKGDPEAQKLLEERFKGLEGKARRGADGAGPPRAPGARVPILPPNLPGLNGDDPEKELEDLLRMQMEMLQRQLQGGGLRAGGLIFGQDGVRPLGVGTPGGKVRLGIQVERPSDVLAAQLDLPANQGLVCMDVPADSVAGKAGIKPNDILLEIGGKAVPSSFPDFQKLLAEIKVDAPVDFVLLRKGKKETIKGVKLPEPKPVASFQAPALPLGHDGGFLPRPPARAELLDLPAPPARVAPGPAAPPVVLGPGETARVEQVNDAFSVFYSKNGVKVTIAGTKEGGVPKAESIEVDDNGKTTRAESIDKLPKAYQEMARSAMKAVK